MQTKMKKKETWQLKRVEKGLTKVEQVFSHNKVTYSSKDKVACRQEQNQAKFHPNWRTNWCKVDEISEAKLCRSFPEKFANIKFAAGVPRKQFNNMNFNWKYKKRTLYSNWRESRKMYFSYQIDISFQAIYV